MEPKHNNHKKKKLFYLLALALIILGIFAAVHIIRGFTHVVTDDAYITGRVHSIASKISGTVKEVRIDDNQAVKKGDLLIEIDPLDYETKVNEAEAALSAEKARLADAEAGIKSAEANLEVQEVAFNQAGLDKKRGESLYQDEVIPKEKHEKIITAYDMAAAKAKALKEELEKAKSSKDLEQSLIKQKEAALKAAQLNLSYSKIYASTDGYITNKSVETGNQIQPAQPLMAVVALDDIWVVANYKETQLKNVKPGQLAEVRVDTYPGKVFSGKVDSIMAATGAAFSLFPPENALGNYVKVVQRIPVKIVFDKSSDEGHVLRIGMSCIPTIITKNE
ncbi:MAG: HlyD family secretion protein [Candidatus Omnitrophota bacterium]|nr:HlyD family secretion protein [Candidatus Omnitrophota bacterium]